ncbi:NAD(P)/FAD-dependent oxidoreductase [Photorhabdus viridis]|uniref:NAD(P)/FAD-dependent oxidoreductase n=1 Tax=Photorhabdus viridis TaxID=3163327 RepID=UPI0033075EC4
MASQWDLIIVGGGLAGSALASWCSQLPLKILLLEATVPGAGGATAHSRGIIRVYDPLYALMTKSIQGIKVWSEIAVKHPDVFTRCGLVYLLKAEHQALARERIAEFSSDEYPIHMLSEAESACRFPALQHHCFSNGRITLWEPLGGYVNPRQAAHIFVDKARFHGVEILEGSPVKAVREVPGGVEVITGVGTRLPARLAVIATGAHTPQLYPESQIFSRTIPLSCLQSMQFDAPEQCVIDENSGGYLRPESSSFFFVGGATQYDASDPDQLHWQPEQANARHHQLANQLLLCQSTVVDGRNGYDGYTANYLPEIQCLPDRDIAIFSGFSGRGAKYIPWAAREFSQQLAERLCI